MRHFRGGIETEGNVTIVSRILQWGFLGDLCKFPAQSVFKDHSYHYLCGELEAEGAATGHSKASACSAVCKSPLVRNAMGRKERSSDDQETKSSSVFSCRMTWDPGGRK